MVCRRAAEKPPKTRGGPRQPLNSTPRVWVVQAASPGVPPGAARSWRDGELSAAPVRSSPGRSPRARDGTRGRTPAPDPAPPGFRFASPDRRPGRFDRSGGPPREAESAGASRGRSSAERTHNGRRAPRPPNRRTGSAQDDAPPEAARRPCAGPVGRPSGPSAPDARHDRSAPPPVPPAPRRRRNRRSRTDPPTGPRTGPAPRPTAPGQRHRTRPWQEAPPEPVGAARVSRCRRPVRDCGRGPPPGRRGGRPARRGSPVRGWR